MLNSSTFSPQTQASECKFDNLLDEMLNNKIIFGIK